MKYIVDADGKRHASYKLTRDVAAVLRWVHDWNKALAPITESASGNFVGKITVYRNLYDSNKKPRWEVQRLNAKLQPEILAQYESPSMVLAWLRGYSVEVLR